MPSCLVIKDVNAKTFCVPSHHHYMYLHAHTHTHANKKNISNILLYYWHHFESIFQFLIHFPFSFFPQIFECCWNKCDWQFEDPMDCFDHCIAESTGHVQTYFASLPPEDVEFNCLWRNCIRLKKNAPPFPHLIGLIKHVREVINKSGRIVLPGDRSK